MDAPYIEIISVLLLITGMIGTVLPILPGLILSLAGLLLYKFGADNNISIVWVWIFCILTLISVILNYVIPAKTNKKYGGTRWGSIGSFVGTIVGFFFIPIPFGFLIGMLLGVFVGELLHDNTDRKKALNSTKGALIGFFFSTGFNLTIALSMFLVVILDTLQ